MTSVTNQVLLHNHTSALPFFHVIVFATLVVLLRFIASAPTCRACANDKTAATIDKRTAIMKTVVLAIPHQNARP